MRGVYRHPDDKHHAYLFLHKIRHNSIAYIYASVCKCYSCTILPQKTFCYIIFYLLFIYTVYIFSKYIFKIAYINAKLTDLDKDFISFIMSKQGEAVIAKEGYISTEAKEDYTGSGKKGTITIAGSTSVAPVMNVLADEYKKLNPDVKIEIQESGSSAGIESAMQGAVEIAMSSRELKEDEAKTLKSQTIALDGIAVIVNSSNTLDTLTSEQVKNIFAGNVSAWEEVTK